MKVRTQENRMYNDEMMNITRHTHLCFCIPAVNLPDRQPRRHDQAVRVRGHLRWLHDDPGAAAVVPLPPPRQPHLPGAVSPLQLLRRRRLHLPR
jgi:hypothetical protein